jgi:hypothetical protein
VNFNKEHKAMLGHCKMILERDGGRIAINQDKFDKLITRLEQQWILTEPLIKKPRRTMTYLMHLDWR